MIFTGQLKLLKTLHLVGHLFGILRKLERINKFLDIAVENIVEVIDGKTDPVIGYPALGKVVGPDFSAPIPGTHQAFPVSCNFLFLFANLFFI